jgi:phage regulator Rha-like protein
MVIKEHEGFRLTLNKHEVLSPKGLFSIDMVQESLKDGRVVESQVYNFFMTKEECKTLANGLTA